MTQTTILISTLAAMAALCLGYAVGWVFDPRHEFWRVIRAYGEVTTGVVAFTAATMALIAEYEQLSAAAEFEPGKAS